MSLECSVCKKEYIREKHLERHYATAHSNVDSNQTFECDLCVRVFSTRQRLVCHIRRVHSSHSPFECYNCERKFKRKDNLEKHISSYHTNEIKKTKSTINRFKCDLCREVFNSKISINGHFVIDHGITLETRKVTLKSFEEFNAWKCDIQRHTVTQFVKQYSSHSNSHDTKVFVCHRSSYNRANSRRKPFSKFPSRFGSKKLHSFCPAEMYVTISKIDGACVVNYTSTHIGHSLDEREELPYISLINNERLHIATRLQDGDPSKNTIYGPSSSKLKKLRRAHHDAVNYCKDKNLDESLVVQDDHTFHVKAFDEENVTYAVTKNEGATECTRHEYVTCGLHCQLCGICFHEYQCSCSDNSKRSIMCKHIHIVGLYKQKYQTCADVSSVPPVSIVIAWELQNEGHHGLVSVSPALPE